MTGMSRVSGFSRIARSTSRPLMPGIITSSSTSSGRSSCASSSRAAAPLVAVLRRYSALSIAASTYRLTGTSSTSSSRGLSACARSRVGAKVAVMGSDRWQCQTGRRSARVWAARRRGRNRRSASAGGRAARPEDGRAPARPSSRSRSSGTRSCSSGKGRRRASKAPIAAGSAAGETAMPPGFSGCPAATCWSLRSSSTVGRRAPSKRRPASADFGASSLAAGGLLRPTTTVKLKVAPAPGAPETAILSEPGRLRGI